MSLIKKPSIEEVVDVMVALEVSHSHGAWTKRNFTRFYHELLVQTEPSNAIQVVAPTKFGKHPTLFTNNPMRHSMVKMYFTSRPRFSGKDLEKDGNIVELLSHLQRAQNNRVLSKEEFCHKILEYFSGPAFVCVSQWVNEDLEVDEIFRRIVDRFYAHEYPEEVAAKLNNISAAQFKKYAQAETEISRLARLVSYKYLPGRRREEMYDSLACQALKKVLPPHVLTHIEARTNHYRALTSKEVPYNQLVRMVASFRDSIDAFYQGRRHASDLIKVQGPFNAKSNNLEVRYPMHLKRSPQQVGFKVRRVKESRGASYRDARFNQGYKTARALAPTSPPRNSTPEIGRPKYNSFRQAPGFAGPGNRNTCPKIGSLPCSLCPSKTHSTMERPHLRPERRISVPDRCSRCPWERHHAEKYCPFNNEKETMGNSKKA